MDVTPPKAIFKLLNIPSERDGIFLDDIVDISDLKDAIRKKVSPLLDGYPPAQLSIKASKRSKDVSEAVVLDPLDDFASILRVFDIRVPEHASVKRVFAENLWLFVDTVNTCRFFFRFSFIYSLPY